LEQGGSFKGQSLCLASVAEPSSNYWQLNKKTCSSA